MTQAAMSQCHFLLIRPGNIAACRHPFGAARYLLVLVVASALVCSSPASVQAQSESDYDAQYDEMEMGMEGYEDDYSDGYDMYSGRSGRSGSAQAFAANRLSDVLSSAFQSTGFSTLADPESAPPVASGPVLLNEATVAYSHGDYPLGLNLYFGHIVAEFEKAESQLTMVKATRLMKRKSRLKGRPVWSLRWGVSYTVRGDATDPQPIKETAARPIQDRIASRGGGGGGYGGDGGYGGEMGMDDYEEGYGEDMDSGYEEGMDDYGEGYGDDMADYGGDMMSGRRPRRGQPERPKPVMPGERLAALERTMLSEEAAQGLTDTLGAVASSIEQEFTQRYSEGVFGRAMTDVTPEAGSAETVSSAFVDLMEAAADPLPLWKPGIVFVGTGSSSESTAIGQKAGLDLLIHIDVYLKPLRGEYVQNISRCKLIHVPSGKPLVTSGAIDSLEFAQQSRAKGQGSKEYIDEQMRNFWGVVDRTAVTADLPQLTPEYARSRVGELLASGGGFNLETLAEVRLYQSQQLLTEDEVLTAFDIVGGEEAMALLYGSEDERLSIVRKWAGGGGGASE